MSEPVKDRRGILAGGNFITDYVKVIEAWPEQDTLATILTESMSNGGGPYNILKDIAALAPEVPLEACGLVGKDANGQWILDDCAAAGIDTTQLHPTSEAATSYTDAMTVESSGRRTFFHQRGANALLAPGHFDFSSTKARVFNLGFLMLLDTLDTLDTDGETGSSKVLRAAREHGLLTTVDCVSTPHPNFRQIVLAAVRHADVLFINEFEIGQVLGREVSSLRDSMEAAAVKLATLTGEAPCRIVLHSTRGAVVADGSGIVAAQASVTLAESEIAGATGAGDAFAAGYLLGLHEGEDTSTCLRYAVAIAAQSLTDATPSRGILPLADCIRTAESHGYRTF